MQKLLPKKASKQDVEDIQKEHQQHNEEEIARVLQQSILGRGSSSEYPYGRTSVWNDGSTYPFS